MVSGLHPPQLDELGLLAALRWFAQEINTRYNLPVTVSGSPDAGQVSDEIRLVLFRIVQEAITNTVRHARATRVQVNLEITDAQIRLVVVDDGQGFDVNAVLGGSERQCIGLLGMIERSTLVGGDCKIRSEPGSGTTVEVRISRV